MKNSAVYFMLKTESWFRETLDEMGAVFPALFLRLILAYEFWEAGIEKLNGSNWFSYLFEQGKFPFPFSFIPPDISWFLATWSELIGAVMLVIGLGTRYASISLMILTVVAAYSVHWPSDANTLSEFWQGYAIIKQDGGGNYKLPLLYLIMFLPLVMQGAGRLSVDHFIARRLGNK